MRSTVVGKLSRQAAMMAVLLGLGCSDDSSAGTAATTFGASSSTGVAPSTSSQPDGASGTFGASEGSSSSAGSGGTSENTTGGPAPLDWDAAFDQVFPQDHVVALQLNPPKGVWAALLAQWDDTRTKTYYESALTFDNEVLVSVGFRLKGWSSLDFGSGAGGGPGGPTSDPGGKFPLKVDFDRFGGPRFHDVNKYTLSNNWTDLSYMRERLTNRLYLSMGVPAARTGYARVSVDGQDNGLYTAVQQIDRCFLEEHFGAANGNGNLYKAVFTSTDIGALVWQGPAKSDYLSTTTCPAGFDDCGIVQKTNETDPARNDYADLIDFVDVLNHSPADEFETAIDAVFDVDAFLRLSAVSVVLASFDGYLGMGHNYYLYHRPDTDKFMMLPWDHNEAYAGHPCGPNAVSYNVAQPVCNQRGHEFILADRIFAVPTFQAQYLAYVLEVIDNGFSEAQQLAWIEEFDGLIRDHIATDANYIADLDIYTRALGYDAPSGPNLGGHGGVEYNLMNFVVGRGAAVRSQL